MTADPLPATARPAPGTAAPLLAVEDLHVEITGRGRTVHALDGVSLDLAPGEALGIVGESGCGKTMTALSVLGLLPKGGRITAGRVLFQDGTGSPTDLAAAPEPALRHLRGNTVGVVFQDPLTSLNPTMTIGAQVAEPLLLHRETTRRDAWAKAEEMLRLVGMPRPAERMKNYPHQLSGGMRQRVAIAMALVCEPRLLIADEPTTALDVTTQHQILGLVDELRARLGMAMILVTHDLGVIAKRVDRVAVMYGGKVAESAGVRSLFAAPRHRYTEALFAALPERAAAEGTTLATIPGLPPALLTRPAGCRFAPRCAYATAECRTEEPALLGDSDHAYACFHPAAAEPISVAEPAVVVKSPPDGRPTDPDILLDLDNVTKRYALHAGPFARRKDAREVGAVAGVSLTVTRGETFGIVGESGCGKSTLGRLAVGLEPPTDGTIRFAGRDIGALSRRELRAHRRDVQLMFQDSYASMDPRMRVGTILREPLVIQGIGDRAAQQRRVAALLDDLGLPRGAVDRYPHEFSGGQRQRLGLARALALSPSLVVADEPVSALDVSVQAQILNLMRDLQRDRGLTYLFISHDLAVVRHLADTVGVMYLGKLVETGPAREVFERPLHPYTRGLLDTVNAPDPTAPAAGTPLTGETPSAAAPPSGCRFRTRCPAARARCAQSEPAPTEPAGPGHRVACHFPLVASPGPVSSG
ncbi:peptide ABC transporter ATP-binding protein [Streptomyces griseoflavus]|uniref:ABC transporter ATP-binding protein n=1 Tax=Streptomyces rimosus TaxID=1927 RepID=UPI0004CC7B9A|nr:ABC transporter ATP-binding protein [Streptomyces rimosus]KOG52330.1 peptide ABC transporter ATP-binding protein [Streptomyces griseoflavus]